jgi:DNA-binding NtrC family response regulator
MGSILIIEDEPGLRSSLKQSLDLDGHRADTADCLRTAYENVAKGEYDAIVTDLNLVGESGMDLIRKVRGDGFEGLIIVITAYGTIETAVEAVRSGADEFIQKPIRLEELSVVLSRGLENRRVRGQLALQERLNRVSAGTTEALGSSEPWKRTLSLASRYSTLKAPDSRNTGELPTILLLGETGSGKGVLARYIHDCDSAPGASSKPFVHVNCAALPANLIEAELFGHEKGAFTDAHAARAGLFELADGGTIFLDEIGELPIGMQAKLLTVVERGVFRRIGGTKERRVRARIVAATNQDLEERSKSGTFRADLLFRLNALTIRIPPLRERGDDAIAIAESTLSRAAAQTNSESLRFSAEAVESIRSYSWPGNVRELVNAVRRATILCDSDEVGPEHLGLEAGSTTGEVPADASLISGVGKIDFSRGPVTFEGVERQLILEAVRHARGNVSLAAKLIGLNRGALRYRIERLGLESHIRETIHR